MIKTNNQIFSNSVFNGFQLFNFKLYGNNKIQTGIIKPIND